jgi:hypothetical protein
MIDESWCMVDVDGQQIRAKIIHKGRGKFRIEDDVGGHYKGKLIDASDIISCNVDWTPPHP